MALNHGHQCEDETERRRRRTEEKRGTRHTDGSTYEKQNTRTITLFATSVVGSRILGFGLGLYASDQLTVQVSGPRSGPPTRPHPPRSTDDAENREKYDVPSSLPSNDSYSSPLM